MSPTPSSEPGRTSEVASSTEEGEHAARVEKAIIVCAQHAQHGLWDRRTVASVLLSRRAFANSLLQMVTQLVAPRLEGVEALANLRDLTLGAEMARGYEGLPPLRARNLCPLSGLSALTSLCLANTTTKDIRALAGLLTLRLLSLSRCVHLSHLTPLHGLSLQQLDLTETSVADITPLAHMSSLEVLRLDSCPVSTLTPHLPGLRVLSLSGATQLPSLTSLEGLPLEELDLSFTCIEYIAPLAALSKLKVLKLVGVRDVEDFGPIAALPSLQHLDLSWTRFANHVALLSGLACLRILKITNASVTDLAPLSQLQLEQLDVRSSGMESLEPLAAMHTLHTLDVSEWRGGLHALSLPAQLTNLQFLSMDACSPRAFQVLPPTLTRLDFVYRGHGLVCWAASLAHLTGLKWLSINGAHVSDGAHVADLSPLRHLPLEHFACNATLIADLSPLASIVTLKRVTCTNCPNLADPSALSRLSRLTMLNLAHCPVHDITALEQLPLERLSLAGTNVGDLSPLSAMHTLVALDITMTQVNELSPLSCLTGLQVLAAQGCQALGAPSTSMTPFKGITHFLWLPMPGEIFRWQLILDDMCSWLHRDLTADRNFDFPI